MAKRVIRTRVRISFGWGGEMRKSHFESDSNSREFRIFQNWLGMRGRKPMLWFPSQPERSEWFEDRIFQNWLGMRDSNPRWRSQSPLPYHLANPQHLPYRMNFPDFSNFFDKNPACSTMPPFLGSSVVEQLAVNQLVVGSNPTRGAILTI